VSRDTNFYYSFVVLPRVKRDAIIAVWDFCRAVDDAVDEAAEEGADAALSAWRQELARCFDGGRPSTPQGVRLQPHLVRFSLPRQPFVDLIDGVAMDLTRHRYETFGALHAYCLRVASAVGLICVEIFGYENPGARDYAIDLGIALQLTNIIRDVALDLKRGRIYLPREDLARFGCTEGDLQAGRMTPGVKQLLAFECGRARSFYERASRHLPHEDARRLVAAEIMSAIYAEILTRIERAGYDVFRQVIRVPRPVRALIAARTWTSVMLRSLAHGAVLRA
jgi:phytoene synthase